MPHELNIVTIDLNDLHVLLTRARPCVNLAWRVRGSLARVQYMPRIIHEDFDSQTFKHSSFQAFFW